MTDEYRQAERKVKNMIRSAKRGFEKRLAEDSKGNSRPFYAYLRKKTRSRATVGPLTAQNGHLITDDAGMAEVLNNYFASVFTTEGEYVPDPEVKDVGSLLNDMDITTKMVSDKIKKLRPASAPGPDGIGVGLLQEMNHELAPALTVVYRKLLDSGHTPDDWKEANVTPIYKKGTKNPQEITARSH